MPMDPAAIQALVRETVRQALQDNLGPVRGAAAPNLAIDATGGELPGSAGQNPSREPSVQTGIATA
jgi:hypothetical protein